MPTGLKGYQQLWSGCAAKPLERQFRPLGAATQPVISELSRERHQAPWRVERCAISMDFWYSCWSLTTSEDKSLCRQKNPSSRISMRTQLRKVSLEDAI
jgi:hypothetical protein